MILDRIESPQGLLKLRQRVLSQGGFSFYSCADPDLFYMVVVRQQKVIGLLAYQEQSTEDPDYMGFVFCEVHPSHRREGVATKLVEEFMTLACARDVPVTITPYEDDGVLGLQPLIKAYGLKHGVYVKENGTIHDFTAQYNEWDCAP